MKEEERKYLTLKQLMNYLHIGAPRTVYQMIDDGLPTIKFGKLRRFDIESVKKYMKSKETAKRGKQDDDYKNKSRKRVLDNSK